MKMKAMTVYSPNDIRIEKIDMRPLMDDEILIKVSYAGICATDIAVFTGNCSFVNKGLIKYPCRIGHEWSGIVEKVGPAVKHFKRGDRVITGNGVSCGVCPECEKGNYELCSNIKSVGTINCWDGCFAEYMYMPERHTYHLADEVSLRAAALAEPLSISLAGIKKCNITEKSTVVVIGTGAIGLGAAMLAKKMGAAKTIVVGRKKSKLDTALKCGADFVVNASDGNVEKQISALTDDQGADCALETSGGAETVMQAINIAKKHAVVALLAFYEKEIERVAIDTLVEKELDLRGIMGNMSLVPEAAEIIRNKLPIEKIITHSISFDEAPEFFKNVESTANERIKAIVEF